ncbi:MAG: Hsp20/alpha crystallin family protein [Ignavibacteriaceae bacterium]|nr:Hsp20/alpha crystallin family protein [Ignavibacteriaceae bacterium]
MTLIKFEPFRDLDLLNTNIRRFFDDFPTSSQEFSSTYHPKIDIYEDDKKIHFEVEVPGMSKKDLNISVHENILAVTGEKKKSDEVGEEKGKNFFRSERTYGSFTRSFTLPDDVNVEKIDAKFTDGILKIEIEKAIPKKPEERIISIN